eukprot:scaffold122571_cov33-Tisochrysis_lutea.AAC.1
MAVRERLATLGGAAADLVPKPSPGASEHISVARRTAAEAFVLGGEDEGGAARANPVAGAHAARAHRAVEREDCAHRECLVLGEQELLPAHLAAHLIEFVLRGHSSLLVEQLHHAHGGAAPQHGARPHLSAPLEMHAQPALDDGGCAQLLQFGCEDALEPLQRRGEEAAARHAERRCGEKQRDRHCH